MMRSPKCLPSRAVAIAAAVLFVAICSMPIHAQAGRAPAIAFASVAQGRGVIAAQDEYVASLSPFDRSARMKTADDISEDEYLDFVGRSVLDWNPDDKEHVRVAYEALKPKLEEMGLPFPRTILFIETTGEEEGRAEYTRANAIILPQTLFVHAKEDFLRQLIAHELFHVLSRNAPELRRSAYAAIGFFPCGPVVFPPSLTSRKITNPDAPRYDYCIQVNVSGKSVWALPLLLSKTEHYDVQSGGEFFNYLTLRFLIVDKNSGAYDAASPILATVDQLSGFYEQIGRNTDYIIHPDEILADNFSFLLTGKTDVKSPDVLKKIADALKQPAGAR